MRIVIDLLLKVKKSYIHTCQKYKSFGISLLMPAMGDSFTVLSSVDSTNNYAMAQVHAGFAKHGNAYFSSNQTGGKGQRGKAWQTMPGENVALSLVIQPGLLLTGQFLLSASIALACYSLVKDYTRDLTSIKWPNDIYWADRKAGGILIENVLQGAEWRYAIAGIGLNVNQTVFPGHLPNPVSLKQITGRSLDPLVLAKELCAYVEDRLEQLNTGQPGSILDEYLNVLYKRGEWVKFRRNGAVFETRIKGVSGQGRLITENVVEQEFEVGEVEWLL